MAGGSNTSTGCSVLTGEPINVSCPPPSSAGHCNATAKITKLKKEIKIKPYCKFIRAPSGSELNGTHDSLRDGEKTYSIMSVDLPNETGDGGRVVLEVDKSESGTDYDWEIISCTRANVGFVDDTHPHGRQISNPTGTRKATIRALNHPGQVKVRVTRKSDNKSADFILNVVRITFEASETGSNYGFDDMVPPPYGDKPKKPLTSPSATVSPSASGTSTATGSSSPYPGLPADKCYKHVSIELNKVTRVRVKIEGGAVGTDFDFESKDTDIFVVTQPQASDGSDFELTLTAKNHTQKEALLRVLCKGYNGGQHTCVDREHEAFAKIWVHVYALKEVEVVVVKAWDSSCPPVSSRSGVPPQNPSKLKFEDFDYADQLNTSANERLKGAVVRYKVTNYGDNTPVDIPFANSNGALEYCPCMNSQPGLQAIKQIIPEIDGVRHVVIVRKMESFFTLRVSANPITPRSPDSPQLITINADNDVKSLLPMDCELTPSGSGTEKITMVAVVATFPGGSTIRLAEPLKHSYLAGTRIKLTAAGWSTDPIIVVENEKFDISTKPIILLNLTMETILHEVGHTELGLNDVVDSSNTSDATSIMHYQLGKRFMDQCLRYLPRPLRYDNADKSKEESQWEKIPRTKKPKI